MKCVLQQGETEDVRTQNDISGEQFHPIALQNGKQTVDMRSFTFLAQFISHSSLMEMSPS
jgi:hypothetical protein